MIIGRSAHQSGTDGTGIVAIGYKAAYGNGASEASDSDTYSTFLGYNASRAEAGAAITNGMALGNAAKVFVSNQVVIGNDAITETILKGRVSMSVANFTTQSLGVPGDTVTVVGWLAVSCSGVGFFVPLYQ